MPGSEGRQRALIVRQIDEPFVFEITLNKYLDLVELHARNLECVIVDLVARAFVHIGRGSGAGMRSGHEAWKYFRNVDCSNGVDGLSIAVGCAVKDVVDC
jgi:hypothetical protein